MDGDRYSSGDDAPEAAPSLDGPTPPVPKPIVSTDWPQHEDLVAIRITWWQNGGPRDSTSYHRLAASLDGIHEPSLWPRRTTDTTIVGRPGGHGRQDELVTVPFLGSFDVTGSSARRVVNGGLAPVQVVTRATGHAHDRGHHEGRGADGWA